MSRRNYEYLSSYDFECLVRDLLSKEWQLRLETFAAGRDGGVDVRFLNTEQQKQITVQCKHSPNRSFSDVKSGLVREATKLAGRRDLGEYWLATSANLSPGAKDKIARIFADQGLVPERVLGRDDLEALLNDHPEVERAHYKLYITSTAVLEMLLNRDLFVHAQDLLDGIEERRRLYVQGEALGEAQNILAENGVLIISGPPGVGKTTLAEMLALNLLAEGFTPYWISEDAREADALWNPSEKQLFLYDDFLGQNALAEKMGKNEDSRLLALMRRVRRSPHHQLILTTREYILEGARQTYERLRDPSIAHSKLVLNLSSYSRANRAHILYNHVYFSELGEEARAALRLKRNYSAIIDHPNYNPRLIKLIIDTAVRAGSCEAGAGFPDFALKSLANPSELWDHIFNHQLREAERDVLLTLSTLPPTVEVNEFKRAVVAFRSKAHGRRSTAEVHNALAVLDGLFLKFSGHYDTSVSFVNPGVRDFVVEQLGLNPSVFTDLVSAATSPAQITALWRFIDTNQQVDLFSAYHYLPEARREFLAEPGTFLDAALRQLDSGVHTNVPLIVLEISGRHVPSRFGEVLDRLATVLPPVWREGYLPLSIVHDVCTTIGRRFRELSENHSKAVKELLDAAISMFESELFEPQDYVHLYDLLTMRGRQGARAQADVQDSFVEYATDVLTGLIDVPADRDVAQAEIDEIESAASDLHIGDELDDLLDEAQEVVEKLPTTSNREPSEPAQGHPRWEPDADEDLLFSSLT